MSNALPAAAQAAIDGAAEKKRHVVVELDNPLKRGDLVIDKVTLRKPMGGDMTGTNLTDLYAMNVRAMSIVIPRISDPYIHAHEILAMDGEDIAALSGKVVNFLLTKRQKADAGLEA